MEQTYDAVLFDLFGTLVTDEGRAIDGAAEVLAKLQTVRWAIVTSCPRSMALALIARAGLPQPGVLVAADDVAAGKPAPDCYILAAQRCGVEPSRCIAVEDSSSGVRAALDSGADVVAIAKNRSGAFPAGAFEIATLAQLRIDVIGGAVVVTL